MKIGLIIFAGVVIVGGVILQGLSVKRKRRRLLAGRPQLKPHEFAEAYFTESRRRSEIAIRARDVLESELRCDLSGLRPEDRIAEDLYVDDWDGMDLAELIIELENAFAVQFPEDSQFPETFGDLVDRLEELAAQHGQSSS